MADRELAEYAVIEGEKVTSVHRLACGCMIYERHLAPVAVKHCPLHAAALDMQTGLDFISDEKALDHALARDVARRLVAQSRGQKKPGVS